VVDPTTPPVPYVTIANDPPPEPVRLNIGIGATRLQDLGSSVAPIQPSPPSTQPVKPPAITYKDLSSSYSLSATWYMTGVVKEKAKQQGDPFMPSGFGTGGNPFGIGAGIR